MVNTNKEVRGFLNYLSKNKYDKNYIYLNNEQKQEIRKKGAKLVRR